MLGAVDRSRVVELLDAIAVHDAAGALEVVAAVASDAADYGDVLGELVNTPAPNSGATGGTGAVDPDPDFAEACARLAEAALPGGCAALLRDRAERNDGTSRSFSGSEARAGDDGAADARIHPRCRQRRAACRNPHRARRRHRRTHESGRQRPIGPRRRLRRVRMCAIESGIDDPAKLGRDLVERLGLPGLAGELALNTSLIESDVRRLKIELAPTHAALNTSGAREALRSALAARFGGPIELDIVLHSPSHETPAAKRRARRGRPPPGSDTRDRRRPAGANPVRDIRHTRRSCARAAHRLIRASESAIRRPGSVPARRARLCLAPAGGTAHVLAVSRGDARRHRPRFLRVALSTVAAISPRAAAGPEPLGQSLRRFRRRFPMKGDSVN